MTHPMTVEEPADDEMTAPLLAAIQHSFEEAMASLDDIARSSGPAAAAGIEPHPGTEKIDLRLVELPAVPAAPTPPTAAMSLAARVVAEQPVSEGSGRTSARQEPVARVVHDSADLATAKPRRGRAAAVISRWFPGPSAIGPTATACDA